MTMSKEYTIRGWIDRLQQYMQYIKNHINQKSSDDYTKLTLTFISNTVIQFEYYLQISLQNGQGSTLESKYNDIQKKYTDAEAKFQMWRSNIDSSQTDKKSNTTFRYSFEQIINMLQQYNIAVDNYLRKYPQQKNDPSTEETDGQLKHVYSQMLGYRNKKKQGKVMTDSQMTYMIQLFESAQTQYRKWHTEKLGGLRDARNPNTSATAPVEPTIHARPTPVHDYVHPHGRHNVHVQNANPQNPYSVNHRQYAVPHYQQQQHNIQRWPHHAGPQNNSHPPHGGIHPQRMIYQHSPLPNKPVVQHFQNNPHPIRTWFRSRSLVQVQTLPDSDSVCQNFDSLSDTTAVHSLYASTQSAEAQSPGKTKNAVRFATDICDAPVNPYTIDTISE